MKRPHLGSFISLIAAAAAVVFFHSTAGAAPSFPTLTQGDFDNIIKELSANTSFHPVTGAASNGSIFGLEFGVILGATSTPNIDNLVQQESSNASMRYFGHAGLLGAVTIPFGITAEAIVIPAVTVPISSMSGVNFQTTALGLKWTLTDDFLTFLPLNLAVRGFYASSQMGFDQTIQNSSTSGQQVNATVTYKGQVTGLQLMVSPKFLPIIEPYAGVGVLSGTGKMEITGSSTATLYSFTTAQSAESTASSTQLFAGLTVRLLLIDFGAEYSRAFDTSTYTGKFSFKF